MDGSGYAAMVRGMVAPMSSKARRWSGLDAASMGIGVGVWVKVTSLRVRVARWLSRPRKLRGALPWRVCWREALAWAAAERSRFDGVVPRGRVLVGEGQRRPGLA